MGFDELADVGDPQSDAVVAWGSADDGELVGEEGLLQEVDPAMEREGSACVVLESIEIGSYLAKAGYTTMSKRGMRMRMKAGLTN